MTRSESKELRQPDRPAHQLIQIVQDLGAVPGALQLATHVGVTQDLPAAAARQLEQAAKERGLIDASEQQNVSRDRCFDQVVGNMARLRPYRCFCYKDPNTLRASRKGCQAGGAPDLANRFH